MGGVSFVLLDLVVRLERISSDIVVMILPVPSGAMVEHLRSFSYGAFTVTYGRRVCMA